MNQKTVTGVVKMNEEMFKHLTNLLRHSTAVTFKIPSIFFKEKSRNTEHFQKKKQEVADAWINLSKQMDLQIYKQTDINDEDLITVQISVKQPKW